MTTTIFAALLTLLAPTADIDTGFRPHPAVVSSCAGVQNRVANPDRATRYCNQGWGYGQLSAFCFNGSINNPAYRYIKGPIKFRARGTSVYVETAFNVSCSTTYPFIQWTSFRTWNP